jgi:hypothetical protein
VLSDIENLAGCTPAKVGESSEWTSTVNRAEEKRANFCKGLDGNPLFGALYGMYAVTLNEMKAVLKVSPQAGQSGAVTKTTMQSAAQDDDFQEIKRRKRHISNNTSQTAKMSTKPVPPSHLQNQCNSHLLRTSQNYWHGHGDYRSWEYWSSNDCSHKPHSTQNDLRYHVNGDYEFQNTPNGIRVITKEMAD